MGSSPIDSTMNNEKIATVAYCKWEKAGRPDGRHEEFWLQAEREIKEDQQLSWDVRSLWQEAKERHNNKIQTLWQSVRDLLKSKV